MIWTKAELLKTLERYEDDDTFAGALWSKEDVTCAFAEVQSDSWFNVDPASFDTFEPEDFWNDYIDVIDQAYEHDISWVNDELFTAILKALGEPS